MKNKFLITWLYIILVFKNQGGVLLVLNSSNPWKITKESLFCLWKDYCQKNVFASAAICPDCVAGVLQLDMLKRKLYYFSEFQLLYQNKTDCSS